MHNVLYRTNHCTILSACYTSNIIQVSSIPAPAPAPTHTHGVAGLAQIKVNSASAWAWA